MQPAINTLGLLRISACLSRHSVDPFELLSRSGITPNLFVQAGRWLPRDLCLDIGNRAAEAAGAPFFGAEVGALIRLGDLGDFGRHIGAARRWVTPWPLLRTKQSSCIAARCSDWRRSAGRSFSISDFLAK